MGFTAQQGEYEALNIATFPVGGDDGKKPLVSNYQQMGLKASRALGRQSRFDCANVGLMAGARNGLTILDIDSPDENELADALDRHGNTPIIARTGSGNFQAWYRHNGEKRHVRPFRGKPYDLLGGGLAVVPLSKRPDGGSYEFLNCDGLAPFDRLPVMKGLDDLRQALSPTDTIQHGSREKELFKELARVALANAGMDQSALESYGAAWVRDRCAVVQSDPITESRIRATVKSILDRREAGTLYAVGTGPQVTIPYNELMRGLSGNSMKLLFELKGRHAVNDRFPVANVMAGWLDMSLKAFQTARAELEDLGLIRCVVRGGNGPNSPPLYVWGDNT